MWHNNVSYLSHFCIWSFVTVDIVQLKWQILNLSTYDRFSHICHNSNCFLQHMTFSVISVIKVTCDIACKLTYLWQIQSHLSIQIVLCYTIMTKYLSLDVIFGKSMTDICHKRYHMTLLLCLWKHCFLKNLKVQKIFQICYLVPCFTKAFLKNTL